MTSLINTFIFIVLSLVGNIIITDEMWALVPMILEEDMLFCRFLKPRNEQNSSQARREETRSNSRCGDESMFSG